MDGKGKLAGCLGTGCLGQVRRVMKGEQAVGQVKKGKRRTVEGDISAGRGPTPGKDGP